MCLPGFALWMVTAVDLAFLRTRPDSLDTLPLLKSTMSPTGVTLQSRLVKQDWSHLA
jgi:hypothetical protein